jgi:hypothetical protein
MAGDGPGADAAGAIYVVTGNGSFGGLNFGDSALKFHPVAPLTVADFFTPMNQAHLASADLDLGSGGMMLLPDQPGNHPHLMVLAGKEGTIYLVDRDNMGKFNAGSNANLQTLVGAIGGSFDTPAFFFERVYYHGVGDVLKAFPVTNGLLGPAATGTPVKYGFPGATPSISSKGRELGVVWDIQSDAYGPPNPNLGPAVLHAYDATSLKELYNSNMAPGKRDVAGNAVKFTVPTVANARVFVGVQKALDVYGHLLPAPSPGQPAAPKP